MILNHGTRDFFINVVFFYLLPIILIIKAVHLARRHGYLKQLGHRSSSQRDVDIEQDVELAMKKSATLAMKKTPKARRIIPKKAPKMKAVPRLKANVPKQKGQSD